MNLASNLTTSAQRSPDHPALRLDDVMLTYKDLDETSARVAGILEANGVGPGDRVGIMLPNVPAFASCYYGILRVGAVAVPMNVLLKRREVAFYLGNSGASLIFAWSDFAEAAEAGAADAGTIHVSVDPATWDGLLADATPRPDVVERADDDTAVILYTSGTTGTPKGAELTHANLMSNIKVASELFDTSSDDVILGALPLFHVFGQTCGLNVSVKVGGCLTLIPRFDPAKALEMVARDKVTVFQGVPTMFAAMLHLPDADSYDVTTLRQCASGGAAMPLEVMRGFEEAFNCIILEGYGLSETSPVASFNHPDKERKPGSIGTPIAGVKMKIMDDQGNDLGVGEVGEIVIQGPNVMKGYWQLPEATDAAIVDGWFHSGDLGKTDDDGYFFIVDRKKDMIIRGGYNIYPREIEEVLYEHPAVREAAVLGVPDAMLGEEVGAAVVLKEGATASAEEIRDHVKAQVAAYKYPRHVWFIDELPKGSTGKILKREITVPTPAKS
ncbi:MAG: long-chain fatty acid--CoA ligase [Acidimicrobiales bacterium]